MMEMKIKIEVPDLAAAVEKLAAAIAVDPNILTPDTPRPQMPAPATGPAPVIPQTPAPAAPGLPPPLRLLRRLWPPLLALLTKYGVQAITQLQPAQYGVFATELRALGAQI